MRSTVLLFEEPELFIHPHLMRRLKEVLRTIGQRQDWQVIVSTHSPFLVDVGDDPRSLVIYRRLDPTRPPTVKQLESDPFAAPGMNEDRERLRAVLDFHPTVCEVFFAKHAVLVEGDTEVATLVRQPDLYRLAGLTDGYCRDVTVVSCDGKWTIIPIARLLRAFDIPMRVIHDRDQKGKTEAELAEDTSHEFHANKRIADVVGADAVMVIDDTFEHVLWERDEAPKSKKDKPYRAWKRVRELCNNKTDLGHAPELKKVVEFAFKPFQVGAAVSDTISALPEHPEEAHGTTR
jgi:predicted ATP-dependent endonuclease of OLD family